MGKSAIYTDSRQLTDGDEGKVNYCRSSSLSSLAHFGLSPLHRNPTSHNAMSGLQSSFSGAGDNGTTPPTLDLSEFPSLSNRGHGDSASMQPNPMAGRAPYGMNGNDQFLIFSIHVRCNFFPKFTLCSIPSGVDIILNSGCA